MFQGPSATTQRKRDLLHFAEGGAGGQARANSALRELVFAEQTAATDGRAYESFNVTHYFCSVPALVQQPSSSSRIERKYQAWVRSVRGREDIVAAAKRTHPSPSGGRAVSAGASCGQTGPVRFVATFHYLRIRFRNKKARCARRGIGLRYSEWNDPAAADHQKLIQLEQSGEELLQRSAQLHYITPIMSTAKRATTTV